MLTAGLYICASPPPAAATVTAPVPRHIEIMFSIERCHLCGVSAIWAVFMKFVCTRGTTYDSLTAQKALLTTGGHTFSRSSMNHEDAVTRSDRLVLPSSATGDDWSAAPWNVELMTREQLCTDSFIFLLCHTTPKDAEGL